MTDYEMKIQRLKGRVIMLRNGRDYEQWAANESSI